MSYETCEDVHGNVPCDKGTSQSQHPRRILCASTLSVRLSFYFYCFFAVNESSAFVMREFARWEVRGENGRKTIDPGWISVRVNKTLTNRQFRLDGLIDQIQRRPPDITDKKWKFLWQRGRLESPEKSRSRCGKYPRGRAYNQHRWPHSERLRVEKQVRHNLCNVCMYSGACCMLFAKCVKIS
jgi:hypothetical protein